MEGRRTTWPSLENFSLFIKFRLLSIHSKKEQKSSHKTQATSPLQGTQDRWQLRKEANLSLILAYPQN